MAATPKPNSLRAAFAPYLPELTGCCCPTCRNVVYCGNFPRRTLQPAEYWAAIAEQLRQVSFGEHQRVEQADWRATLPAPTRQPSGPQWTFHVPLGVGFHPTLDELMVRANAEARAADTTPAPIPLPAPALTEPEQLDLFDQPAA